MKVLLVAPLDPQIPGNLKYLMGGENTYTRMLLDFPLKGIKFIHFETALNDKSISYHWLQYLFLGLQKFRLLPLGPRVQVIKIQGSFDLVYTHVYPVKLTGHTLPLVISDSSSNIVFMRHYLKWPIWRIALTQSLKKFLFRLFEVIDGEVNTEKVKERFVFSKWAQGIKNHELRTANWEVIYPGLPERNKESSREVYPDRYRDSKNSIKFLFVGVWFERKGGRILLEAFRKLSKRYPHISLTILGQLPKNIFIESNEKIIQKDFVSYKELQRHYQTHDILIHVPPEIEGYGMTVPEAMSYGMLPVVSDICVLPEFVTHMKNGLVVKAGSAKDLEMALEIVIKDSTLRKKLSQGAQKKFRTHFSLPVFQKQLSTVFNEALK